MDGIVLHSTRLAGYTGARRNDDILDGMVLNNAGQCVHVVDTKSPALTSYDPASGNLEFTPVADNLFGGWLAPDYFKNRLGSEDIIGVTWTFSDVDGALGGGLDGYRDGIYTEQFCNTRFDWNVQGSIFLDPSIHALFDVESIVTH